MSWTYEVAITDTTGENVAGWFAAGPKDLLAALPDLAFLDVYTPAAGTARDPYNHDGGGPAMLLMLGFEDRDALSNAVSSGAIAAALGSLPDGARATGAVFQRQIFPVGNGTEPAPLAAPFSYVVRYQLPAEDEAAFIDNYIATHPTTQAHLPGIRAILCYLPQRDIADPNGLRDANYLIGNEVAFDDMEAFNGAMASPVREELREHFRTFPTFSGINAHYPMQRERVFGAA